MALVLDSPDIRDAVEQNELDVYRAAATAADGDFVVQGDVSWVVNRPYWPSYLLT